jgi:hypothetical protein
MASRTVRAKVSGMAVPPGSLTRSTLRLAGRRDKAAAAIVDALTYDSRRDG